MVGPEWGALVLVVAKGEDGFQQIRHKGEHIAADERIDGQYGQIDVD